MEYLMQCWSFVIAIAMARQRGCSADAHSYAGHKKELQCHLSFMNIDVAYYALEPSC